jgi:hypothetical protein
MKKLVLILLVCLFGVSAMAQNVQTHYDLGKGREYLTTTVEMFRPDKFGSTFFFIDMDYGSAGVEGVSLAYWEIARAITLFKSPIAAHLEYNGGFGQYMPGGAYQINDAYLGGLEYSVNAKDFSRGFTIQTLFKSIRGKNEASFQLTGVWYMNLLKNKVTFSGFADFWKEDNVFGTETTDFVFLAEPQLWYNFCKNFSAGGEVEVSSNFAGNKGFMVNPTVAMKYTF